MESIQKDMQTAMTGLGMDDQVIIQAGEREILITMKENVTFRTGEAEILKGSEPILGTIAQIVKRYPSFQVEIDGHTDDLPINTRRFPSNWELSVARATSVLKYLIISQGLDPARFTIKGNAEQRPLSPNSTPELRAQNRRVEIRLRDHQAGRIIRLIRFEFTELKMTPNDRRNPIARETGGSIWFGSGIQYLSHLFGQYSGMEGLLEQGELGTHFPFLDEGVHGTSQTYIKLSAKVDGRPDAYTIQIHFHPA